MNDHDIFHVHTFRCGHAENISDKSYIEKAIEMGAEDIWFSDHAPFPGNPFKNRMSMSQLDEYLDSLNALRYKYQKVIQVHIGLEIEYVTSFDRTGYYRKLKNDHRIEFLILGQHLAEINQEYYTFDLEKEYLREEEYKILGRAIVEGINSGHFDYVAHPDRIFRRRKLWDEEMQETAKHIISAATRKQIPLEINMHSIARKNQFWPQFWKHLEEKTEIVFGLDAHSMDELEGCYIKKLKFCREYAHV